MTEQQAAIQQVRETLIKSGILAATRLRELRSQGKDFNVAVSVGGGLAVIATKASKDKPSVYRFGAVHSTAVASVDHRMVGRWNQQEPNHPVELRSLQAALNEECSRVFLLLHEIEQNIKRTEGGS